MDSRSVHAMAKVEQDPSSTRVDFSGLDLEPLPHVDDFVPVPVEAEVGLNGVQSGDVGAVKPSYPRPCLDPTVPESGIVCSEGSADKKPCSDSLTGKDVSFEHHEGDAVALTVAIHDDGSLPGPPASFASGQEVPSSRLPSEVEVILLFVAFMWSKSHGLLKLGGFSMPGFTKFPSAFFAVRMALLAVAEELCGDVVDPEASDFAACVELGAVLLVMLVVLDLAAL
ncbi:hypothetical protein Nepgr_031384 [Nepenthes gracilis]|uniref:Uncharacterized protein n=1 Tax=Nepenthes gracilis TaxID=150966 RepID=A0AAD3TIE3_NEPGR|nr:hypothetical protein Nepgr_031384 [Nepenthes gracilis]